MERITIAFTLYDFEDVMRRKPWMNEESDLYKSSEDD